MLILRLVLSLAFVAVLMFVAFRIASKRAAGSSAGAMEVLARHPLTRTTSVSLIRVGDRAFIIGSGETQVTLIGETDLSEVQTYMPATSQVALPGVATSSTSGVMVRTEPRLTTGTGPMAGSVFDATMWRAAINGLRDRTVRR